jgi:hypothetical protein
MNYIISSIRAGYMASSILVGLSREIRVIIVNLDELVSKNIPVPSITQFELWANKFENNIRVYLMNDFRECGIDASKPIDFNSYYSWINKDHNLYLAFATKYVTIATSLLHFDEIGYCEENVNYPSFK